MVIFAPQPLFHQGKNPSINWLGGWVGPEHSLVTVPPELLQLLNSIVHSTNCWQHCLMNMYWIQKLCLYFGSWTHCTKYWCVVWLSSVTPYKCCDSTASWPMTTSCHILSSSLFSSHHTNWCYVTLWAADSAIRQTLFTPSIALIGQIPSECCI